MVHRVEYEKGPITEALDNLELQVMASMIAADPDYIVVQRRFIP
jgi:hypothetical protein